jgi:transposase
MRRGRPKADLTLNESDREVLERWSRPSRTTQSLALRSRIILRAAEGVPNRVVAEEMRLTPGMVGKWRARFIERGVDGLLDEPRPGARRKVPDAAIERLVTMTLESSPQGATRWSTRSMAKASGLTQSTVSRVWRAFGLHPRRMETVGLSRDRLLLERARDIVGLYLDPSDGAVVLSADEKARTRTLDRTQPRSPTRPAEAERRTHDGTRRGTTSLFAALETATGRTAGAPPRRLRSIEFRQFLDQIDEAVPGDLEVHLILDNYGTHKTTLIRSWLARRPRFHVHFSRTRASWTDPAGRRFGLITEEQLLRGSCHATRTLEAAIRRHIDAHNEDPKPFVWTKSDDLAFESPGRPRSRDSGPGH